MRTITLEEHFATQNYLEGPGGWEFGDELKARAPHIIDLLCDVGEGRLAAMDEAGIDVQVLSLNAPGVEQLAAADAIAVARATNDVLTDTVKRHPARYLGFASMPTPAPDKAAAELETRVRNDGFKGALINGHARGRYLDDKFFWPIFEAAAALDVPIYLHPTRPPKAVIEASFGGFAPAVTEMFAGPGWGWHIETAVHVIRLILGGVFDRFPQLQVAVGHLGEALPFMLPRLNRNMPPALTKLKRPLGDYLRGNIHYTFGGFNFPATFLDLLLEVGVSRIMFSVDHPYGSMKTARAFLDQLPVSPADRERIAHGNAETLLKL
jgi:uncharacterized protein